MDHVEETVQIRPLQPGDAEPAAVLSAQLGYPATAEQMQQRIARATTMSDRVVFAAMLGGTLAGWIDASVEDHILADPVVMLGGLVVRDGLRGHGVGRKLCAAVEQWTAERGIDRVRVRSQTRRADAHRFYLRDGYQLVKTSAVFEKTVLSSAGV